MPEKHLYLQIQSALLFRGNNGLLLYLIATIIVTISLTPATLLQCQCNFLQLIWRQSTDPARNTYSLSSLTSTPLSPLCEASQNIKEGRAASTWPVFAQQVPRPGLAAQTEVMHLSLLKSKYPPGPEKDQKPWIFRNTQTAYSHSLQHDPRDPSLAHLSLWCQGHRLALRSVSTCWAAQVHRKSTSIKGKADWARTWLRLIPDWISIQ